MHAAARAAPFDIIFLDLIMPGINGYEVLRKLKDMGTRPGVADLSFVLPGGRAAFIELKAPKGRQSPEQKAFEADCTTNNAPYAVCRSIEEVAETLRGWGVQLRARSPE